MRPDPATDALIGQLVGGRYVLRGRIGKGGMGVVYEADHTGLGKRVAVKLLLEKYADDPEVVERFHREARTASAVGDAHIVEVTDAGVHDDGRSYIVMELLEGGNLAEVMSATGPMPAARAVQIIRQVLRGLAAAHGKNIVHRDMKPENVFLVNKGEKVDYAKIMDFGISKLLISTESKIRLTATGAVMGTPVYMAPEQALGQGEIDARVDLYAVGVMLYEMLAGHPPFQAANYIALVTQHLNMPPPPLGVKRPDLPVSLLRVVHTALEKEPDRRYRSATAMAAALPTAEELWDHDRVPTFGSSAEWQRTVGSTPFPVMPTDAGASAAMTSAMNMLAVRDTVAQPGRARRWPFVVAALTTLGVIATAVGIALSGGGAAPVAAPAVPPAVAPATLDVAAAPVVTPVGTSDLEIVSTPGGATVFIDGVERGRTPLVVARLEPGIHEVRIEKPDFSSVVLNKSLRPGRDETVSVMLATPAAGASAVVPPVPPAVVRPRPGDRPVPPRAGKPPVTAVTPPVVPAITVPTPAPPPRERPVHAPRDPYGDDPPATKPPPPRTGGPDQKENPYD